MNTYDITFTHPSRWIIYGPSSSGKSTFVKNLLKSLPEIFSKPIQRIIYCSGADFPKFNKVNGVVIEKHVNFSKDLIESFNPKINNLIILDDNMHSAVNDITISDLFTKWSHHKNVTVLMLMQNLFPKSKFNRDISLNSNYIVLMKNPRDLLQIQVLSNQISGSRDNYIVDAYKDATESKPFSYLFIDLNQETPFEIRIRTNVLPDEFPSVVYCKNEFN